MASAARRTTRACLARQAAPLLAGRAGAGPCRPWLITAANVLNELRPGRKTAGGRQTWDEDGEDPRAGLVEMLLEYQRLKSATAFFAEKNETGRDIYVKPPERQDDAPVEYHHPVNDLIRAANKMLRRTKRRLPPPVTSFQGIVGREPAPVEGRVTAILKRFLYRMRVPFMRLFDDARNRSEIVATFLAVLELSKTRRIRLEGDGEEMELMLTNDNTK